MTRVLQPTPIRNLSAAEAYPALMKGSYPMNDDPIARAALIHYGLAVAQLTLIHHANNVVYRVHAGTHHYALRIHRRGLKRLAWIRSELHWLNALRMADFRVPMPAAPLYQDGENYAVLFHWHSGSVAQLTDITPERAYQIGGFAARLHAHVWTPPADFERPRLDAEGLFGAQSPYQSTTEDALINPSQREIIHQAETVILAHLTDLDTKPDSFGLIHGDLIPKNLIFDGDQVIALDFDDCGFGYYLYDLAPLLWFMRDQPDYPVIRAALVEGYRSIRPEIYAPAAALDSLIAARHIASIRWIAGHAAMREQAPQIIAERITRLTDFITLGSG
ncbi:MAG: phosphotransferase [Anaerolineae bacterium]|nr:phosphotransferase [Anaerolineae bacterium]